MVVWGRMGLLLGVLAHAGLGNCAHGFAAGAHASGAGFRAVEAAARVAPRVLEHAGNVGARVAAVAVDAALEAAAEQRTVVEGIPESEGGEDDAQEALRPPGLLRCLTRAECGPGGTCDVATRLCRSACRARSDCFANERCVLDIDSSGDPTLGGCVPH